MLKEDSNGRNGPCLDSNADWVGIDYVKSVVDHQKQWFKERLDENAGKSRVKSGATHRKITTNDCKKKGLRFEVILLLFDSIKCRLSSVFEWIVSVYVLGHGCL